MSGRTIKVYPVEANEAGVFSKEALLTVGIDFTSLVRHHEDASLVDRNDRRAHLDLHYGCVSIPSVYTGLVGPVPHIVYRRETRPHI